MKQLIVFITFILISYFGFSQDSIYLWPGNVPGETAPKHQPVITANKSGDVTRISDITNPALIVFKPDKTVKISTSIVVCPGGAYQYLAIDKEGSEVAQWLNKLGITAYVLQYRVPDKKVGALQDIQRAIRLVRNIDSTQTIGVMGFSAGGSLSAHAATNFKKSTYKPTDHIDTLSCRPDFAMLIYPAYLDLGENHSLTPELTIGNDTPPVFLFSAADDPYGNSSLVMTTSLRDNKIPVELHIVSKGGHGYGLRKGNVAAEIWPILAEEWILNQINK
jgi:acetyl esterase/lipase